MVNCLFSAAFLTLLLLSCNVEAQQIQNDEPFNMLPSTGHRSDRWRLVLAVVKGLHVSKEDLGSWEFTVQA
jgi:hypothetical protein